MSDDVKQVASLLPYEQWTEDALREVVVRALEHTIEHGLLGEHHFYLTFRTDDPEARLPGHLKARYPQEITIVLQHRFEGLTVDRAAGRFSVRLYFGGVPSTLVVPFRAITAFADPSVRYGLRFQPVREEAAAPTPPAEAASPPEATGTADEAPAPQPQVVSLDAFRRRTARD